VTTANMRWGLGRIMRQVASRLTDEPVTDRAIHEEVFGIRTYDDGYAYGTLLRLTRRGIAHQNPDGSFVRGPNWLEAAKAYGWTQKAETQKSVKARWFIVNGRVGGDLEDTLVVIQAPTREDAMAAFEQQLLDEIPWPAPGVKPAAEIYVNAILECETEPKFV